MLKKVWKVLGRGEYIQTLWTSNRTNSHGMLTVLSNSTVQVSWHVIVDVIITKLMN